MDKDYKDIWDKFHDKWQSMPLDERRRIDNLIKDYDWDEFAMLDLFIKLGYVDLVEEMIKRGIDVNKEDRYTGETPLTRAICSYGSPEIASVLLENGAQFDRTVYGGAPLLHNAAEQGYTDVVKKMVEKGGNLEEKDGAGRTPLWYAAAYNQADTVKFLMDNMDNKANVNEVLGEKLLRIASSEREKLQEENSVRCSHLEAAIVEDLKLVKMMLENGASMNSAMDYFGKNGGNLSFLMNTWEKYQPSSFKEMLPSLQQDIVNQDAFNKDVVSQDKSLKVETTEDANLTDKEEIPFSEIDPAFRDDEGRTLLMLAAERGDTMMIEELLSRGVDPNAQDKDGKTAYNYLERFYEKGCITPELAENVEFYLEKLFNPEKNTLNPEYNIDGGRLQENNNGMFIKRYSGGALWVQAQINDKNQFHGLYEDFHENGQLHIKTNHIDGKEDGLYQQFYDNGQLNVECYHRDGVRDGRFVQYDRNGNIEIEANYKNGSYDGEYKQYYPNGQVSLEISFVNGYRLLEKSFDESGKEITAPTGSKEDKEWEKRASQSHRNETLKEILKAREHGDKEAALKVAEEFHTKPRKKGTIAQITALKFGKDK